VLPVSGKGCETLLSGENGKKRIGRFLNGIAFWNKTVKILADS
jgi:hypothetical protein